jgi:hypothetical protein
MDSRGNGSIQGRIPAGEHHGAAIQVEDIHTANEERQVFIKRKFDDYKSTLNRYPKSAKYS